MRPQGTLGPVSRSFTHDGRRGGVEGSRPTTRAHGVKITLNLNWTPGGPCGVLPCLKDVPSEGNLFGGRKFSLEP